jgi:HSP20 family protein
MSHSEWSPARVAGAARQWEVVAVLRFDPFSDWETATRALLSQQSGSNRSPRFMPMDLCKVDDHYVLTADLPGVDPGSVEVTTDNGTLTLSAHRSARSEDSAQWLASERFYGTYRRQLSLGDGVDASRISATYENGVLTVTIPVAEAAKPRRIEVVRGEGARSIESSTVDA